MQAKKMADSQASQNQSSHANVNTGPDRAVILEVQKNHTERLRVSVSEYRGRMFVDLRTWYVGDDGEYRPSGKGVVIRPSQVAEVVQGLLLAARAADPQGAR
jgi:hypothetical protein